MNAALLLELAREWLDISEIARRSSASMGAMNVPIDECMKAAQISRQALELSLKLEDLAKSCLESSRRD